MRIIRSLSSQTIWLYRIALELDIVPVSAQRLLWLQEVTGNTYAQNDDGDWLHYSGQQILAQDSTGWTLDLLPGEITALVELVFRKLDPGHFLLDPGSLSECEEILNAKILSFDHTDPARERQRKETAAERGVPYIPPVGEGFIGRGAAIERNLNNVGALEAAVGHGGKERDASQSPVQIADHAGMLFRPAQDIIGDMTRDELKVYKRYSKENKKKGFPAGEEYAKKLAAETIQEARERGTEGAWLGNLRGQLRERLLAQYVIFSYYREIHSNQRFDYYPNIGQEKRNSKGYLHYPATGYDIDNAVRRSSLIAGDADIVAKRTGAHPVLLCWAQLRTIARMHLHNQLLDLLNDGKLPGIDITGRAPRTDHPAIQAIAQAHSGSYLDFLQAVRQHGSGGLLHGEPAGNPDAAKRAASERMEDYVQSMVITDEIRQTVPKWFARHLVDTGRLLPSPLREQPRRVE